MEKLKAKEIKTLSKTFLTDMETPVSCFCKLTENKKSKILLESLGPHRDESNRYSVIAFDPVLTFVHNDGVNTLRGEWMKEETRNRENPFNVLRSILNSIHFDREAPFERGMLTGYIGYDSIKYLERIEMKNRKDIEIPEIFLNVPSTVILFDNVKNRLKIIKHYLNDEGRAEREIDKMINELENSGARLKITSSKSDLDLDEEDYRVNIEKEVYFRNVEKAKRYIREGDIFQAVLSRRYEMETDTSAFDIYRALRTINPSPYNFYICEGDLKIIGSSPETMMKLKDGKVTVHPIAGTRKRGKNEEEDKKIAEELLNDEKENAEHVMLVDLGRNDVGKISKFGTVRVEEFRRVENYSHVMHIVSKVTGKLKEGEDAVSAFCSCFPAGTVSGAPKIRAMEIIEELETTRRVLYAGAVGYFDFKGDADTCIAIRTIVMNQNKVYCQAGGGIVADSRPETEFEETENKAKALLKAVQFAKEALL